MNEAETILELESVVIRGRWRDGVEALPGPLSLRVRRGETWLVLGGMGSGKSALLEAMVGLRALGGGTVRVFGRELSGLKGAELAAMRRRMGLVFEGRGRLMSGMTVLENVTLPVCYHGNVDVEAAAVEVGGWMEEMELEGLADVGVGRLGMAWARRVALARAVVQGPELLLLDDPMGGLDPVHARWWRGFLGRLRDGHPRLGGQGVTLVMATGSPRALMGLAGRCAVMTGEGLRDVGGCKDALGRDEAWTDEGDGEE